MLRWLARGALVILVLVVAALAALPWLAGPALRAGLSAAGLEEVRFDQVQLGLDRASVSGLRLGPSPGQEVARLEVDYRLGDLLRGRIGSVSIDGLRLRGRLTEHGVELNGLPAGEAENAGSLPPLPWPERLVVRDARLELATPVGALSVPFEATLEPTGTRADFRLVAARVSLEGAQGRVTGRLELTGSTSRDASVGLVALEARRRIQIDARNIEVPDVGPAIDGSGTIMLAARGGRVTVSTSDLEVRAQSSTMLLQASTTATLTLDENLDLRTANATISGRELRWRELEAQSARLELSAEGPFSELKGTAEVDLEGGNGRLSDLSLDGLTLAQAFDFTRSPGRLVVRLAPDGTMRIAALAWQDRLRAGDLSIAPQPSDEAFLVVQIEDEQLRGWQQAMTVALEAGDLGPASAAEPAVLQDAAARVHLSLSGTEGGYEQGRLLVTDGRIRMPAQAVILEGIRSELALSSSGLAADQTIPIDVASISQTGEPPWFRPLKLRASLRPSGTAIPVQGRLSGAGGALAIPFRGSYEPERGSSRLVIDGAPVRFEPGTLQPADLAPALGSVLERVSGRVDLDGELVWQEGALQTDLALLLDDLSLTVGPARLEQVQGIVRFDRLRPPGTPPGQQVSAGRLEIGVPLTQGFATFQLEPGGPLAVQELRFRFAGGRLRAESFKVGSDGAAISTVVKAEGLDLARILEEMPLEGLTGEGRISGRLPVVIEGGAAMIRGGELVSERPGWLRYRPSQPPAAFEAGAEGLDLLLQALENFRYEELRITLDGRTDSDMDIQLRIKGANPSLYDGFPIEFNLNLEGELGNILRSTLSDYHIPERLRRRMDGQKRP